jgi:hypothetical protein
MDRQLRGVPCHRAVHFSGTPLPRIETQGIDQQGFPFGILHAHRALERFEGEALAPVEAAACHPVDQHETASGVENPALRLHEAAARVGHDGIPAAYRESVCINRAMDRLSRHLASGTGKHPGVGLRREKQRGFGAAFDGEAVVVALQHASTQSAADRHGGRAARIRMHESHRRNRTTAHDARAAGHYGGLERIFGQSHANGVQLDAFDDN